jgi:Leucine rich repeat
VSCAPIDHQPSVFYLDLRENKLQGTLPESIGQLRQLYSLDVSENDLRGPIPLGFDKLAHLEWLTIFGNHFSGRPPRTVIRRWLSGSLGLSAEENLLTDVSDIDYESNPSSLLCGRERVILRSGRSATLFTENCRNSTPGYGTTFCEVKEGEIGREAFARLAWLLNDSGFYSFRAQYYRGITEATFESTRVIRAGRTYQVVNYANAGPFALWVIQSAFEGVASSAEWQNTKTLLDCPRWDKERVPGQP